MNQVNNQVKMLTAQEFSDIINSTLQKKENLIANIQVIEPFLWHASAFSSLKFENCKFEHLEFGAVDFNELIFDNCKAKVVRIIASFKAEKIILKYNNVFNEFLISGCKKIELIDFEFHNIIDDFQYYNSEAKRIHLQGNFKNILIGSRVKINSLSFRLCNVSSILELNDIKPLDNGDFIELIRCNFNLIKFHHNDFDSFKNGLRITSTSLSNSEWLGDFPKKIHTFSEDGANRRLLDIEQRELYREIKHACFSRSDNIKALIVQRKELNQYKKNLKYEPFKKRFILKIQFFLNELSNEHGTNWFRGFLFTVFMVGLPLFLSILLIEGKFCVSSFSELSNAFLQFLQPISNITKIGDDFTLSTPSIVINAFARIFITYGYYQTIQAFRFFGKK